MAAAKGRNILLKVSDGTSPDTFTTIGGIRSRTITINNETVDITTSDEAPWRTLMGNAGIRSVSISGSGVFKDGADVNRVEDLALNGNLEDFQAVFENLDYFQGAFAVTRFEYAGEHNGEQTFSIALESAGVLNFTRA